MIRYLSILIFNLIFCLGIESITLPHHALEIASANSGIGHSENIISSEAYLIEDDDVCNLLKPLELESDKYAKGKVLSLSGSINYTGAALLSSLASMKAGSGILKNIYPYSLNSCKILTSNSNY